MVKLQSKDVVLIKMLLDYKHLTHQEIADLFGVSRGHITKIKNEKRWKNDIREKTAEEKKHL